MLLQNMDKSSFSHQNENMRNKITTRLCIFVTWVQFYSEMESDHSQNLTYTNVTHRVTNRLFHIQQLTINTQSMPHGLALIYCLFSQLQQLILHQWVERGAHISVPRGLEDFLRVPAAPQCGDRSGM